MVFCTFSSVQSSRSVMSDSLWPHESQHARPHCPSPTPGVHSDSRPLSQWCHPAISSSVIPFSSCSQSLPASESFPMSQLFAWGGQSTGVSALETSKEILPKKSQGWSPSEWTGWISFLSDLVWTLFFSFLLFKSFHLHCHLSPRPFLNSTPSSPHHIISLLISNFPKGLGCYLLTYRLSVTTQVTAMDYILWNHS